MSNDTVAEVPIGVTENPNAIFITYTAIITMALIPIYIGSFRSLTSKLSVSGQRLSADSIRQPTTKTTLRRPRP